MIGERHVLEMLPAYALGSLDAEEKSGVEEHLGECPACQRELEAYQAVAAQLPLAVPLQTPPPRLRQAILDRAGQVSPASRRSGARAGPRPALLQRLGRSLRAPAPAWALVGVALLAVVLLGFNLVLLRQVASPPASAFRVIQLAGTDSAPQASAWMVVSADGRSGTLIAQGLPALPPGQQYQLWLNRNGQRASGGVFSVDAAGYASEWVYTPVPLADFKQFGVTVEPQGGSPAPTGARVLAGGG